MQCGCYMTATWLLHDGYVTVTTLKVSAASAVAMAEEGRRRAAEDLMAAQRDLTDCRGQLRAAEAELAARSASRV